MGKRKEQPLHNVLSIRVDDELSYIINKVRGKRSVSMFLKEALLDKLAKEKEGKYAGTTKTA